MTEQFTPGQEFVVSCPAGSPSGDRILLGHGGGGRLSQQLINEVILPAFANEHLNGLPDAAALTPAGGTVCMSTDSFVVKPLEFPGGSIASLAVIGTVNDVAMMGAAPAWLSCALILEEGFEVSRLRSLLADMAAAARSCGVRIVTGDTKVVERGSGDGLFINTTGVGFRPESLSIGPQSIQPGDRIIVSGDIGRHGTAILCARQDIALEVPVTSDCTNLWPAVQGLLARSTGVHCMRDLTRGGLAAALTELAQSSATELLLLEDQVPVSDGVASVCEVLGLEAWNLACEGRFAVFVAPDDADDVLCHLRDRAGCPGAAIIGHVQAASGRGKGSVMVRNRFGLMRPLMLPAGDPVPRIC